MTMLKWFLKTEIHKPGERVRKKIKQTTDYKILQCEKVKKRFQNN